MGFYYEYFGENKSYYYESTLYQIWKEYHYICEKKNYGMIIL